MKNIWLSNLNDMQKFNIIWFGQFVSMMGSAMTSFALIIWAYEKVGKASTTALMGFFSVVPYLLLSPLAGIAADRFSRKRILLACDFCAGIMTLLLLYFYTSRNLQITHLYFVQIFLGIYGAFQGPAYSAAVTMLLPKDKYTRASGMRSFSDYASRVGAPFIGGLLLALIGFSGILMIDIITFYFAVFTLFLVNIPQPLLHKSKDEKKTNLLTDFTFGLKYLMKRRGLFLLLFVFIGVNLFSSLTYFAILPAMILARTGNNQIILASVQSALGLGGLAGSLIVTFLGGPKRKMTSILFGTAASFLFGDFFLAVGSNVFIWSTAAFLSSFFIPLIIGAENALWQSKVEPMLQGRLFSLRGMIQQGAMPLGYILGGFLADYVFEPAMRTGGSLPSIFGFMVGTGKGSGMALMFFFTSFFGFILCLSGYLIKDLRNLDEIIPDHDQIQSHV